MQEVITGSKSYVYGKHNDLKKQGYIVVKRTNWPDGKITYVMEKLNG